MRTIPLVTLLALGVGASAAHADGLLYLGAGVSKDKVDNITHIGTPFSGIDKTSWKLLAGVRPIKLFGVEADYMDLGNRTSTFLNGVSSNTDAKAFAAYAVGYLPLPVPFLDVYGKAGLARWKLEGANTAGTLPNGNFFAFSDRGTDFAWGLGVQAHIGNIGGRLEYERFNIANTNGARVFTLAVIVSLL